MQHKKKVLVIGSGPIVIGQAAEFDYAGAQACKALREEGFISVLLNSNPATIMTDKEVADRIYIEPINASVVERILERENIYGVLGTLGGQTGLNLLVEMDKAEILKKHGVKVLGTTPESIELAEDRDKFRSLLEKLGEPTPPSEAVESVEEAILAAERVKYPVVVRPAYTLGGAGGGIASNEKELKRIAALGIKASRVSQILVEKSLWGWKEVEYEVIRDGKGNVVTVCNMENLDPVGVHTGDSIVVAPSQTLDDKDYQVLRDASLNIVNAIGVKGGCNVQFAYRPRHKKSKVGEPDYYVIEVNPRVSRSSALASKATGYPIARVATKIACGLTLDQIQNQVTGKTKAAFEPVLDYCVVKIPRWPFDKFPKADRGLGTQMKATGEVMAIERNFEAALQKAVRSLDYGHDQIDWERKEWRTQPLDLSADDERLWKLASALRQGVEIKDISYATGIDPWFISAIDNITTFEKKIAKNKQNLSKTLLFQAKKLGFSDQQIGRLVGKNSDQVRGMREQLGIKPVYKMVDTCAGEFEAVTPYFYSTYEVENEAKPLGFPKVVVLGSGPIRIGQGIEFDYSSVHAVQGLKEYGINSIMVNSNPETVSTDFDISSRLYFEPLDEESVLDIIDNEKIPQTMFQYGGQTAIKLSQTIGKKNLPVSGTSPESIDLASERGKFEKLLKKHSIPLPKGAAVLDIENALDVVKKIGYPVIVRPSYVLGGRGMRVVQNSSELKKYFKLAFEAAVDQTILIDRYMLGIEVEVDAVCDGENVLIPGILQHIERAGVHSGDSACIYPAPGLHEKEIELIVSYTKAIGKALKLKGLMNIQYVIPTGEDYSPTLINTPIKSPREVYVLEVNPRSSRTVPFISKVTDVPLIKLAMQVAQGKSLERYGLLPNKPLFAVKFPVFSNSKLTGVDTYLGPEMQSTGEVMGIDKTIEGAIQKGVEAADLAIKSGVSVLLSIADKDKKEAKELIERLGKANSGMFATAGTAKLIKDLGYGVTVVEKRLDQSGENVLDVIRSGKVGGVINTVTGDRATLQDGFHIRRTAVEYRVPCLTSIDTALAATYGLTKKNAYNVATLNEYVKGIS